MFSKVIVNLTGISLILYISATPTQLAGRPWDSEAQNINDDIYSRA